jgi:hypothetical protein
VKRAVPAHHVRRGHRAAEEERDADSNFGDDIGGDDETVIANSVRSAGDDHRYPAAIKAFYMKPDPNDPDGRARRGHARARRLRRDHRRRQRIDDLDLLLQRIKEHNLPQEAFEWYLDVRRYGTFPHGGFGMGIERVRGVDLRLPHLRETIPYPRMMSDATTAATLRVIPLGGLGEIGMNLMVYECRRRSHPRRLRDDVPRRRHARRRRHRSRHDVHLRQRVEVQGAVPHARPRGPHRRGAVSRRARADADLRHAAGPRLRDRQVRGVRDRGLRSASDPAARRRGVGSFRVEAIRVTHSIVDAIGYAIRTPAGTIIHTGDFKIDHTPIDAKPTDLARFAQYGEEGVLLLVSDSTNALVPGHGPSEKTVGSALDRVFANVKGRIIVTTFASHIHRVQQVIDTARKHHRKVLLVGRSLVDNVETAERLGYLKFPREARASSFDLPARDLVIMTTGTQGEPSSALSRIAIGEHKQVSVEKGDVVIISARTIPGNERAVVAHHRSTSTAAAPRSCITSSPTCTSPDTRVRKS